MDVQANSGPSSPALVDDYSKPRPRAPRSPAQAAQVRKQNRRQEYLGRHPNYLKSPEHEFADPLLYDTLIRRFQTPEEREKEGRTKGYSRTLELDLLRGEARLSQLASSSQDAEANHGTLAIERPIDLSLRSPSDEPQTKADGRERWEGFLRQRFILGGDEDFDYDPVDMDDSLDILERRDEEDAWFNDETPRWAGDKDDENLENDKHLTGETGVQDY